ncbi:Ribonuclease HII [Candidatus Kinetoplastibacterium sorsogonicusi]|uniref:Ribonuclease HII n=1 Tax=Candidatus Kinetoplastidibacterium kentomonadis TaxID=1576550 RepID=A0A3Q8ETN5_9PROT|nr:ribonuclease HII [Candidatus Kinetoplastibacterium sorsogonicusi]AWD32433.1 Ribonuclease HII [Candidatus Kinetoplastibacterium sorsogonicusi]
MKLLSNNILLIAGVDEVGTGALAGPVYAAAVIINYKKCISELKDSKLLSHIKRQNLSEKIKEHAIDWSIACSSVEEIDNNNILYASLLAMNRAIKNLKYIPSHILIDGLHAPANYNKNTKIFTIVKGDLFIPTISAASILAKTARDLEMIRLHTIYPQYQFDKNKGYGTAFHIKILKSLGPCNIHRKNFHPIKRFYKNENETNNIKRK